MILLVNALLQDNTLDYADCCQIKLAVLQHKINQTRLANNRKLRQQIYKYTFWIANKKIEILTKDKMLRLSIANVNPETLEKFDIKVIVERQKQMAPLSTSLLKVVAGLDNVDDNAFDLNDELTIELGNWGSEKKKHLS